MTFMGYLGTRADRFAENATGFPPQVFYVTDVISRSHQCSGFKVVLDRNTDESLFLLLFMK